MSNKSKKLAEYRQWYHYLRLNETLPAGPLYINVEPTNACNLNCLVCSTDASRKRGFMDLDLFRDIIADAADTGVQKIALFLAGEPLLHRDLPYMIEHIAARGMETRVRTNGTLLTREKSLQLLDAGLDFLGISFDGDNRHDYEEMRAGASYDEVLENLHTFLELKKKRGTDKPFVSMQMIKMPGNPNPGIDPDFIAGFDGLPINEFNPIHPHSWRGEVEIEGEQVKRGDKYYPCRFLWTALSITWDGKAICCADLNGRFIMGDVTRQSLSEIWNGERILHHRRLLKQERYKELPLCAECHAVWPEYHPRFFIYSKLPPLDQAKKGIRGAQRTVGRLRNKDRDRYDKPRIQKIR